VLPITADGLVKICENSAAFSIVLWNSLILTLLSPSHVPLIVPSEGSIWLAFTPAGIASIVAGLGRCCLSSTELMALSRPEVFIITSDAAGKRALRCERHSGGEALGVGSRSETRTGQSVEVTQRFLPGALLESHALELDLIDSQLWKRVENSQSCKEGILGPPCRTPQLSHLQSSVH
jgi:hypothetical protein